MELTKLRVNGRRLQSTLEEMAQIGGTAGGGVQRLTLSDEDRQARDLFVKWLREIDCEITVDEMGNIFGRRPGKNNDLPPVMTGSHIDTHPTGGKFDGNYGVLAGLEVVRTDPSGTSIHVIRRADYDFHSLAMYGRTPADFLPTNSPARVLSIAQGEVRPVLVQSNMESDTFERQHLETTHLVWTDGPHVSHSWHPERFSNLPRRYIRQTDAGEFVFNLIR